MAVIPAGFKESNPYPIDRISVYDRRDLWKGLYNLVENRFLVLFDGCLSLSSDLC